MNSVKENMITRQQAQDILEEMTDNESLLRHARSIELVMTAYAAKLGEDMEKWSITGLLHDADYDKYPDQHPKLIVDRIKEMGDEEIAYAISAHYTKWGNPCKSMLDKMLLACDELTGFVIACCHVRPGGINTLNSKSVIKKLKSKGFAAKVDRDEVYFGVEQAGLDLKEHIEFIIGVLKNHQEELLISDN
ncbi:MAG: HD domain-containing protein [Cyclobacteriaceae bacterium]|nr:HD domain-containing protein [Cyclobacteriaceae bacterium]